ncbi:unnamed protein product [Cuscuta europaea]|uniref:Uncharacterized protein n=1 Tax=Cuscuta europaea TaxID=41803 RepID=A0A9P0YKE1_CUSEU|nr:unnamed protein product [Cuscuta europaea]
MKLERKMLEMENKRLNLLRVKMPNDLVDQEIHQLWRELENVKKHATEKGTSLAYEATMKKQKKIAYIFAMISWLVLIIVIVKKL